MLAFRPYVVLVLIFFMVIGIFTVRPPASAYASEQDDFMPLASALDALLQDEPPLGAQTLKHHIDELFTSFDDVSSTLTPDELFDVSMTIASSLLEKGLDDNDDIRSAPLSEAAIRFYMRAYSSAQTDEARRDALDGRIRSFANSRNAERGQFTYFGDSGTLSELIPLLEQYLALSNKIEGDDSITGAVLMHQIGRLYQQTSRAESAVPLYRKAFATFSTVGVDDTIEPGLREGIKQYAWDAKLALYDALMMQLDTANALSELLNFVAFVIAVDDENGVAELYNRIGMHFYYVGDANNAISYLTRAHQIADDLVGGEQKTAVILDNLAAVYARRGDISNAIKANRQAYDVLSALDDSDGAIRSDKIKTQNNYASLLVRQNHYKDAISVFNDVLVQKAEGPDCLSCGIQYFNIASAYLLWYDQEPLNEHISHALSFAQKSLQVNLDGVGELASQTGDAFELLSRVQQKAGAYAEAHASIDTAMGIYSRLYALSKISRVDFADHIRSAAIQKLHLMWDAKGTSETAPTESFVLGQTVSWSVTVEAQAQFSDRLSADKPAIAALLRQRQDTSHELETLTSQLTLLIANSANVTIDKNVQDVRNRIALAEAKITKIVSDLSALGAEDSVTGLSTISVDAVRMTLKQNEAVVFFVVDKEVTYQWLVTPESYHWRRIDVGEDQIVSDVQALRCGLDRHEWARTSCRSLLNIQWKEGEPLPFSLKIAAKLYEKLFGQIKEEIGQRNLIIAASGPLLSLPFNVLITDGSPSQEFLNSNSDAMVQQWLIFSNATSVIPSPASLTTLERFLLGNQPLSYLGIGNPSLSGGSCPANPVERRVCADFATAALKSPGNSSIEASRTLGRAAGIGFEELYRSGADLQSVLSAVRAMCPLPETQIELECVSELLGGSPNVIKVEQDASEKVLFDLDASGELGKFKIIHFATHGLVAGDVQYLTSMKGEPALVLTPPDVITSPGEDGLLTSSEVARLHLDADWVILSACSTAAGGDVGAEGLSGLVRSFMYAGTRAFVVSHWPVLTDVAVRITTQTFVILASDPTIGRAEAVRRATIELIRDQGNNTNAFPSVWAPLFLVGI